MNRIFILNRKIKNLPYKFARPFALMALYLCLCTIGIYHIKIFQGIEFANYDLLFYFKQPEVIDTRITIVEWDEKSISDLQESIISDNNLNKLFNKILEYNPRTIGLDLYRDIPVPSPKLNQTDNIKAYNSLNQTFKTNSNIFGIQKTVIPKIRPSSILLKEGRAAAADISPDKDVRVRKIYTFPTVDEDGNPTEVPYIGVALGYQYLSHEGWQADNIDNGLKIYKDNHSLIFKPLPRFLNSNDLYQQDSNWKFYLHWRKTKSNTSFNNISVTEVFDNQANLDSLFRDRLVIIGNVTNYGGDIHRTALDRWQKKNFFSGDWQNERLTKGVEIVAQASSSIISNALDNRKLIYPAPPLIIYISIILPLISLGKICEDSFSSNISLNQLRGRIALYVIIYIIILLIACFVSFSFFGIWFSITPSIFGIILGWFVFTSLCYAEKDKRDFHYLKLLMKDFKHNIRGVSRQIASANRAISRNNNEIANKISNNLPLFEDRQIEFLENLLRDNINSVNTRKNVIEQGITRINSYQERTTNFLNYTYSNSIHNTKIQDLNYKIDEIVKRFVSSQDTKYNYVLEPSYDQSILPQKIYIDDWLIIVENLISNAVYAINPELKSNESFEPKISIKTINMSKHIKLIVEDNGIGIPKNLQQQIFFPFVSFKDGRGDGMGLHLVSQIINCRGGKLVLESSSKIGTKFTICLPKIY